MDACERLQANLTTSFMNFAEVPNWVIFPLARSRTGISRFQQQKADAAVVQSSSVCTGTSGDQPVPSSSRMWAETEEAVAWLMSAVQRIY